MPRPIVVVMKGGATRRAGGGIYGIYRMIDYIAILEGGGGINGWVGFCV